MGIVGGTDHHPQPVQEFLDGYYFKNGPCCAGCDWWRHFGSLTGECLASAPVAGDVRMSMLRVISISMNHIDAGHIMTDRAHLCGDFKDEFDWASLPLAYLKRIGAPATPKAEVTP